MIINCSHVLARESRSMIHSPLIIFIQGCNLLCIRYNFAWVEGGAQGVWAPPLEIKKQKKKKKKKRSSEQILSYFTYILLLFQSKKSFSQLFSELGPPTEK